MGKHINHNQTNCLKEGIFLGMLVIVGMWKKVIDTNLYPNYIVNS